MYVACRATRGMTDSHVESVMRVCSIISSISFFFFFMDWNYHNVDMKPTSFPTPTHLPFSCSPLLPYSVNTYTKKYNSPFREFDGNGTGRPAHWFLAQHRERERENELSWPERSIIVLGFRPTWAQRYEKLKGCETKRQRQQTRRVDVRQRTRTQQL